MRAGTLRHHMKLQRRGAATTDQAWGNTPGEWADIGTVYANIVQITPDERVENEGVYANAELKIVTRYNPDILPTDRLTRGDQTILDIIGINDINGRHISMEIFCRTNLD